MITLRAVKRRPKHAGLAATVESDDTLTAERLGQTYRIHPSEEIDKVGYNFSPVFDTPGDVEIR
jgi:hypothetical protein